VLHGAAGKNGEPLKSLGKILQHARHEKGRLAPAVLQNKLIFQAVNVEATAGVEPALTDYESLIARAQSGGNEAP
jgi:hypothetical protein